MAMVSGYSSRSEPAKKLPRNLMLRGGIYYVRVKIDGRERWRSTGHTTLPSAIRRAEEILVSLRNDRDWKRATPSPTFGEWLDTYMEVHAPATLDVKKFNRERKAWRTKRISDIRPTDIKAFFREMGKKGVWNESTRAHHHRLLVTVFNRAKDDGLLEKNPMDTIERDVANIRTRVLTREEEKAMRPHLSPNWDRWMTIVLGTGMRLGESLALHGEWVQGDYIHIPASVAKNGKGREIPIFTHIREALDAQLGERGEILFPSSHDVVRKRLNRATEAAGVDPVWPHALRHTFGTRYLQGGGDIYILSKILGHSSVTITEKVYAHLLKEDLLARSQHVRWE